MIEKLKTAEMCRCWALLLIIMYRRQWYLTPCMALQVATLSLPLQRLLRE